MQDGDTIDELKAYLQGRIKHITEVRIYPTDSLFAEH